MKIALFSDIHANLPALEAFFVSIDQQKPDSIYCQGDLVGYNIWPNEVINEIRKRGISTSLRMHGVIAVMPTVNPMILSREKPLCRQRLRRATRI